MVMSRPPSGTLMRFSLLRKCASWNAALVVSQLLLTSCDGIFDDEEKKEPDRIEAEAEEEGEDDGTTEDPWARIPSPSGTSSGAYSGTGVDCLPSAKVEQGVVYRCPDGSLRSGTLQIPEICLTEGQQGCVLSTATDLRAANLNDRADRILAGTQIGGVSGMVVLPVASSVVTGITYGPSSATAGTYSPDSPDAATVRPNDTTNGVSGTYVPDFPAASSVLTTDTTDGVTGTVVLPTAAQVQTGVTFGAAGGLTGTHDGVKANCTNDGDTHCTVPSSGTIKAADASGFTEWDIRKKRDAGGSLPPVSQQVVSPGPMALWPMTPMATGKISHQASCLGAQTARTQTLAAT